jgi:2-phospho-L-lactate transferase/gluconeogenesis factor (CofD/UPF0052 family)
MYTQTSNIYTSVLAVLDVQKLLKVLRRSLPRSKFQLNGVFSKKLEIVYIPTPR